MKQPVLFRYSPHNRRLEGNSYLICMDNGAKDRFRDILLSTVFYAGDDESIRIQHDNERSKVYDTLRDEGLIAITNECPGKPVPDYDFRFIAKHFIRNNVGTNPSLRESQQLQVLKSSSRFT